jgi:hypothetical protein
VKTFPPTHRLKLDGDDISVANLNRRRPRIRARLPLVTKAGRMARQRACIGPPRIEQGKCCWMRNASDGENRRNFGLVCWRTVAENSFGYCIWVLPILEAFRQIKIRPLTSGRADRI